MSNPKRSGLIALTLLTLSILLWANFYPNHPPKKNLIFMVTDGMGPASVSLARSFRQHIHHLPIDDVLALDKHLIGTSRTRSNDSLVTDSAAGATAFSCALKSYNGAIGVDANHEPCGTILEALKAQGYHTGLVVTTRITDATPAAFSAHADFRWLEDLIAQHQLGEYALGRQVDLILGGGRVHFRGGRKDGRDLVSEAVQKGWSYVGDRKAFDSLDNGHNVSLPLLGLLAETDIPYDIDRDPAEYPSLAEQVRVALTALEKATKHSDKGFFLLIEGSRIDHAGHHNDPAAQVREVLAYDEAFQAVVDFIDATDVETTAISTSDHETGGLVTARQVTEGYPDYLWYPEVLKNASHSGEYTTRKILSNIKTQDVVKVCENAIRHDLGITDYTPEDVQAVVQAVASPEKLLYTLNNLVSVRSQTGWSTHGHSAVDVNIYAHTNSEKVRKVLFSRDGLFGNHENTDIGKFMEALMSVDLDEVTEEVRGVKTKEKSWQNEQSVLGVNH